MIPHAKNIYTKFRQLLLPTTVTVNKITYPPQKYTKKILKSSKTLEDSPGGVDPSYKGLIFD